MADILVDTAGWGHLVHSKQEYHVLAGEIYLLAEQQHRKLITTNYIVGEFVALLTSPLRVSRAKTIEIIDDLKSSPQIEVIHVDAELDEQAWQLLKKRPDKEWSLVDCVSFVLMQQRGITDALTTDHHFEQAGFVCLLKPR